MTLTWLRRRIDLTEEGREERRRRRWAMAKGEDEQKKREETDDRPSSSAPSSFHKVSWDGWIRRRRLGPRKKEEEAPAS